MIYFEILFDWLIDKWNFSYLRRKKFTDWLIIDYFIFISHFYLKLGLLLDWLNLSYLFRKIFTDSLIDLFSNIYLGRGLLIDWLIDWFSQILFRKRFTDWLIDSLIFYLDRGLSDGFLRQRKSGTLDTKP